MSRQDLAAHTFTLDVVLTSTGLLAHASGRLVAGDGAEPDAWLRLNAIGGGGPLALDLTRVTALDAAGVGRLLRVQQQLAYRDITLRVSASSWQANQVLQLAGVDAVLSATGDARSDAPLVATHALALCA